MEQVLHLTLKYIVFGPLKYFNAVMKMKKSSLKEWWGCHLVKKKSCIKLCQMHFKQFDSNDWELFPQNTH